MSRSRTEQRAVRSEDPSLSPAANDLLTDELQAAVGRDQVTVPVDTPRRNERRNADHSRGAATLTSIRPVFIVMACVAVVVAAIIALSTDQFIVLAAVIGILVVCLVVVATGALQLTTETEHMDPSVAARLEEEGVPDPDRVFTEMLEDFTGATEARGVPEVVSGGHNDQDGTANTSPAEAAMQQRSALTPGSGGTTPAGSGSAIAALPWWVTLGATAASLVGALVAGGRFWAVPVVVVPICLGWIVAQRWMKAEGDGGDATSRRPTDDGGSAVRRLTPVAVGAATLAVVLVLVLGWVAKLY